jgi:ATP-dependent protease ClpP protease subunit
MSGMDAKEYGIVDHVISNRDDLDSIVTPEES